MGGRTTIGVAMEMHNVKGAGRKRCLLDNKVLLLNMKSPLTPFLRATTAKEPHLYTAHNPS